MIFAGAGPFLPALAQEKNPCSGIATLVTNTLVRVHFVLKEIGTRYRYRISKLYFVTFLDSGKILYSVGSTLCNYELPVPIILFDHFRETILLKQLPVPVKFCVLYLTLMMMCLK